MNVKDLDSKGTWLIWVDGTATYRGTTHPVRAFGRLLGFDPDGAYVSRAYTGDVLHLTHVQLDNAKAVTDVDYYSARDIMGELSRTDFDEARRQRRRASAAARKARKVAAT